jgi:hypothetical protein
MQQSQKRGALNGIPSANLQMCGLKKKLISAGRKVFFCFFFLGFRNVLLLLCCNLERKKPNR